MDRAIELGDASVPFRFDVHALVFDEDAVSLETYLHQELASKKVNRVNQRREFFYTTPAEVRAILEKRAGSFMLEYKEVPEALEWRASGSVVRRTPEPANDAESGQVISDDARSAGVADSGVSLSRQSDLLQATDACEPADPVAHHASAVGEWDPPNGDASSKAAWYVSPDDAKQWRRWDGSAWTDQVKPRA